MNTRLRLPDYLKTSIASLDNAEYKKVKKILLENNLNTVCNEARCPNKCKCYSSLTATFMILGKNCTRNCAFCNVCGDKPAVVDINEPEHIADAVNKLGLKYCVITSVTRDDLYQDNDFGSVHYFNVIDKLRHCCPDVKIEVLTPDFCGNKIALDRIVEAKPDVFNHNIETIARLYPVARQMANFTRSLDVLRYMKEKNFITKSGFMLGLGEDISEIHDLIHILDDIKLDIVTVGQYIQPSKKHLNVSKYYTEQEFKDLEEYIKNNTSIYPVCAPLARSSYQAFETYMKITHC